MVSTVVYDDGPKVSQSAGSRVQRSQVPRRKGTQELKPAKPLAESDLALFLGLITSVMLDGLNPSVRGVMSLIGWYLNRYLISELVSHFQKEIRTLKGFVRRNLFGKSHNLKIRIGRDIKFLLSVINNLFYKPSLILPTKQQILGLF